MTNDELDRLIATDVMGFEHGRDGWRLITVKDPSGLGSPPWPGDALDDAPDIDLWHNASTGRWHPTHDIAQAFEAVDQMRKRGWTFSCECPPDGNMHVDFYNGAKTVSGSAWFSLSEAICLAIYNVLESEK